MNAFDVALGFSIPERHARGRLLRIGPALGDVLSNHDYPPRVARVLSEALVLAGLLGSLLKDDTGQLTLQAQNGTGPIDLLVADYKAGALRGYVRHDPDKLAQAPLTPSLFGLFGEAYLAVTFDQAATKERYQGIVPLEGESLAQAVEYYFFQSEQVPSVVRLATGKDAHGAPVAAGILLQHLPEGEEGRERLHVRQDQPEWLHVQALAETVKTGELLDPALGLDELLWRLFGAEDEVRVAEPVHLTRGCRCDPDHIKDVLARFPAEERANMADEQGVIGVDCAFCARSFPVPLRSLEAASLH